MLEEALYPPPIPHLSINGALLLPHLARGNIAEDTSWGGVASPGEEE